MIKKVFSFLKKLILALLILSILLVILYRFLPPPVTFLMLQRVVEQKTSGDQLKLSKDWVGIENISPYIVRAVIASEDQLFMNHNGFDVEAIKKAYKHNQKSKRVKGGSTITQQVAKNVFLWPGRSWLRKGLEAYFTVLIEFFWSKKRIIEVYLNVIEMGNGIYGVEAASKTYFHESAVNLSKQHAALIAAILPNPRKWSPASPNAYILKRQSRILKNMSSIPQPNFWEE